MYVCTCIYTCSYTDLRCAWAPAHLSARSSARPSSYKVYRFVHISECANVCLELYPSYVNFNTDQYNCKSINFESKIRTCGHSHRIRLVKLVSKESISVFLNYMFGQTHNVHMKRQKYMPYILSSIGLPGF